MLRNDQISGLVLVALARRSSPGRARTIRSARCRSRVPGYMPLLIAIFLGAMGLLVALRGGGADARERCDWPEARRAALIACSRARFARIALEPLGYRLTIARCWSSSSSA